MKIRRHIFSFLSLLSLLSAVVLGWLWINSFAKETRLVDFVAAGQNYTLKSKWGQFVLEGPPLQQGEDSAVRELASRMSNDDFNWSGRGPGFVMGEVRQYTPTWNMLQEFLARRSEGKALEPALRNWIGEAMDERQRFVVAYLFLRLELAETRELQFGRQNHWPSASIWGQTGIVDMAADETKAAPDFLQRPNLKKEWRKLLRSPRGAIFEGWVFLAAMLLPIGWITRPRFRKRTWRTWLGNAISLVLIVLCVGAVCMWVRSYWVVEQWTFERKVLGYPRNPFTAYCKYLWLGSEKGSLKLVAVEGDYGFAESLGYARRADFQGWAVRLGKGTKGETYLKMPGIEFYSRQPQPVSSGSPGTANSAFPTGVRSLSIGWWLIACVSAIAPARWGWRVGKEWRRIKTERRLRSKLCEVCGYDLRETSQRCPECGNFAQVKMS